MVLPEKTLGVNLVDFFRARWSCRKPSILDDYFDSTNGLPVSGSGGENLLNLLAGNFCRVNIVRR